MKKIVSLFYLEEGILGKDFFLAPFYLSKELGWSFDFVFPRNFKNEYFPSKYRGANLIPIKSNSEYKFSLWKERQSIYYVCKNATKIDLLYLIWLSPRSLILAFFYKLLNPKGIVYVKLDVNETDKNNILFNSVRSIKRKLFFKLVDKYIDFISCETNGAFNFIKKSSINNLVRTKLLMLPNSFDESLRISENIKIKQFEEKENIFLIVGRIGDNNKNCELILDAIKNIDLNNWKILFVGPVENHFDERLNTFKKNFNRFSDNLIIIGPIYDKKMLWDFYNRSKVFMLTSNKEGFPNVFPEALRFGCFVISTKISSASFVTDEGKIGRLIDIGDSVQLSNYMTKIVNAEIDLKKNYDQCLQLSTNKFLWPNNTKLLVDLMFNNIK